LRSIVKCDHAVSAFRRLISANVKSDFGRKLCHFTSASWRIEFTRQIVMFRVHLHFTNALCTWDCANSLSHLKLNQEVSGNCGRVHQSGQIAAIAHRHLSHSFPSVAGPPTPIPSPSHLSNAYSADSIFVSVHISLHHTFPLSLSLSSSAQRKVPNHTLSLRRKSSQDARLDECAVVKPITCHWTRSLANSLMPR
jgi:hypothetical protein